ncbi:hypothetical protein [Halosimplex sp. TS25]|uniref:hypothetical protein n=1 Tax=Halosimplex rarum TaxID=3396619 RepID=UPI0039E7D659
MLPSRYNTENLRRLADDPGLLLGEVNRVGCELNKAYHRRRQGSGVDVMAEDWDNLLILDGCRYDMYREHTSFDRPVDRRRSAGSDSWEFLEANFAGRQFHDTVYVTANPHAYRLSEGVFHHRRNLLDDAWDPEVGTVRPAEMAAAAREAHQRFPDKRLLVHFMQPHFPFLGETGRRLDEPGIDLHMDDEERSDSLDVWDKLRYGDLDRDLVWRAYRENLDIVLEAVRSLDADLDGKTVVTTDHGNLVGDRLWPIPVRGYGHPRGLYAPQLIEIPWQVVSVGDRRTIRSDEPVAAGRDELSDDVIEDRLQNLGYKA